MIGRVWGRGCAERQPLELRPGDRAPTAESQRRAPCAPKPGRPGGDVGEKREELSVYFYGALCICPDCFTLNSVAGNLTGM